MKEHFDDDRLLASYFLRTLNESEERAFEEWKGASEENRMAFEDAEKVRHSLLLLDEMKGYNMTGALSKVHKKINQVKTPDQKGFLFYWQRIAAILFVPLLIAGAIYYILNKRIDENSVVWQTISTPPGVKFQAQLPDGTLIWLNSGSSLKYPSTFIGNSRNVKLTGEAFFDVAKDKKHPFLVDLGKINIEVVGTKFDASNYVGEKHTEVVLTSGNVRLFENQENERRLISEMKPGQQAVYHNTQNTITLKEVDTEKYISWVDGRLVFRDDSMEEVVNKLNRWFNVQIEIADPKIKDYIYTATFQGETIDQVLSLIAKTSPVEYAIIPGKRLNDGSFERQRIILKKR